MLAGVSSRVVLGSICMVARIPCHAPLLANPGSPPGHPVHGQMSGKGPELSSVTTLPRRSPIPPAPVMDSFGVERATGTPSMGRPANSLRTFSLSALRPLSLRAMVPSVRREPVPRGGLSTPCRAADISRRVATGQGGGSRCSQVRPLTPGVA